MLRSVPALYPRLLWTSTSSFCDDVGYVESNIGMFVRSCLHQNIVASSRLPSGFMVRSLYDTHPPSAFPYTRTSHAYSAVIQLYSRSQLLPTRHVSYRRLGNVSPWCRFGCGAAETAHNLFVSCPKFTALRERYAARAHDRLNELVNSNELHSFSFVHSHHVASALFTDEVGLMVVKGAYQGKDAVKPSKSRAANQGEGRHLQPNCSVHPQNCQTI
ncbi:hypothetical protein ARMGADRAFT_28803 [Armillaria gallica]|uniref:Uncharacterized protein n=1 Tax=Armillaria gallica TaxID=47427 RepID=A0A2H3EBL3_ARMGA|nr:hypothetical protein ARMGADRAFT_28803 [Armillaria gallica]